MNNKSFSRPLSSCTPLAEIIAKAKTTTTDVSRFPGYAGAKDISGRDFNTAWCTIDKYLWKRISARRRFKQHPSPPLGGKIPSDLFRYAAHVKSIFHASYSRENAIYVCIGVCVCEFQGATPAASVWVRLLLLIPVVFYDHGGNIKKLEGDFRFDQWTLLPPRQLHCVRLERGKFLFNVMQKNLLPKVWFPLLSSSVAFSAEKR